MVYYSKFTVHEYQYEYSQDLNQARDGLDSHMCPHTITTLSAALLLDMCSHTTICSHTVILPYIGGRYGAVSAL